MKPVLLLLAALCAALLFAPAVEAGVTVKTDCCVTQAVVVDTPAVVLQVKTEPVTVAYQEGTRRLKLLERLKLKRKANKSIRAMRVATLEPVKQRTRAVKVLGLNCID